MPVMYKSKIKIATSEWACNENDKKWFNENGEWTRQNENMDEEEKWMDIKAGESPNLFFFIGDEWIGQKSFLVLFLSLFSQKSRSTRILTSSFSFFDEFAISLLTTKKPTFVVLSF